MRLRSDVTRTAPEEPVGAATAPGDPTRSIPGLHASGTRPEGGEIGYDIRGSTTILELLRMFPDGRAAALLSAIQFPCAHCGGAVREPLTLAARRHKRSPRAVLDAFRALVDGEPTADQVERARERLAPPGM